MKHKYIVRHTLFLHIIISPKERIFQRCSIILGGIPFILREFHVEMLRRVLCCVSSYATKFSCGQQMILGLTGSLMDGTRLHGRHTLQKTHSSPCHQAQAQLRVHPPSLHKGIHKLL